MSSLTCKCVLYRSELNAKGADPMELNFEGLEIKKYQRIEFKVQIRKMGSFVWLSGLLPELWSLKCQIAHFLYFLVMKLLSQFGQYT